MIPVSLAANHHSRDIPSMLPTSVVSTPERDVYEPSIDSGDELIVINVGGKKFQTFKKTLQRFPKTLLGDPSKRVHFFNPQANEYFFDRHRKAFSGIIFYYQSNGTLEKPPNVSESIFTQEVLFFELGEEALGLSEPNVGEERIEEEELPRNKALRKIWILFEHPTSSILARILAIISVVVILLSILVFCLETIPQLDPSTEHGKHMQQTWVIMNCICNAWFTFEYFVRLLSAPNKFKFIRATLNIVDLLSILPFYITISLGAGDGGNSIEVLRVIRVIRVIRIFKLTRHSRGLHILGNTISASSHELAMLVLFLAIGVILFSSAVYYAESRDNPTTEFKSIPHAFWWAVVTMTTVGYGDLYPKTLMGKLIGTLCAISGVLVIALPVPVIVSNFEYYYKEEKDRRTREEERQKKTQIEKKLPFMKDSMRMVTEASMLLAGGKDQTCANGESLSLKDRFRKFSFGFRQPLVSDDDSNACDTASTPPSRQCSIKKKGGFLKRTFSRENDSNHNVAQIL